MISVAKRAKLYPELEAITSLTISKKIGVDLYEWSHRRLEVAVKANQYLASCLRADQNVEIVYGFYDGECNNKFIEAFDYEFIPITHYWTEDPNGVIIDPMRWIFEQVHPYTFIAGRAACKNDYDKNGTDRRAMDGVPDPGAYTTPIDLGFLPRELFEAVQERLVWPHKFDAINLSWLAHQNANAFGLKNQKDLYTYMMTNGFSDLLDQNQIRILGLGKQEDGRNIETHSDARVESLQHSI